MWPDGSAAIALGAGQVHTGAVVTVKRGVLLSVRVNDTGKALTAALSAAPGKVAGNPLSLMVAGPAGFAHNVPMLAQDASGRTHGIAIAYDAPHKLFVHSSSLGLKDASGRDYDGVTPIAVQVAHGSAPVTIVVNVGGAVKP